MSPLGKVSVAGALRLPEDQNWFTQGPNDDTRDVLTLRRFTLASRSIIMALRKDVC